MTPGELELFKVAANLGGAVLVAVVFGWFGYKLLCRFGVPFIAAQQAQAVAMSSQADAMGAVKETICEFTTRDSTEHREILLAVQVVGAELEGLNNQIARLSNERGNHAAEPHPKTDLRSVGAGVSESP